MELGKRIAAWRQALGMSDDDMAEAVGVTVAAVYQWEKSLTKPSVKNLEKIAGVFGVSMERFYGRVPKRRAS